MPGFYRKLKKLNPFATRPSKGIPKVAAVHNLQHYAAQHATSPKEDNMNNDNSKLFRLSSSEEESPPFPQPTNTYQRPKPLNEDEAACSSYIAKTKELPNMPMSFLETCNTGQKKNGQPIVSSSVNQKSSSPCKNSYGSSSKSAAQKPHGGKHEISFSDQIRLAFSMDYDPYTEYDGSGYGKSLKLLPGCSSVPRESVKKQTVPLGDLLKNMNENKGKTCVGEVHILRCIHHPSRKLESKDQSTSSSLHAPLDMQPGFLINCAIEQASFPRKATPPTCRETNTVDEVGVDAKTLIYYELTFKPENCRTIIVPPPAVPPTPGLLNDHEIVVSLQQYKGTMIVPKQDEQVSVPKPTAPPPTMNF